MKTISISSVLLLDVIDRSEGGSSMSDGSIELMVHRRTLHDDSQGVGEPINETAYGQGLVVRGRHYLLLESPQSSALYHRHKAQQLFMNPLMTYALPDLSYEDYSNNYHLTWSALTEPMPFNVHLLTIDQLTPKVFLIRIEHYFELNEDETYSKPVQVDVQNIFDRLGEIVDLVELTLAANLPLNQMERLVWTTDDNQSSHCKAKSTRESHCLVYRTQAIILRYI
jgi:lysosomal alpha-mannosidase